MRNLTRFSTVLTACLALGAAACGDDKDPATTTDATTNTSNDATTSSDDSTVATTDATTPADVDTDPCDPNPCTTQPAAECDQNNLVTYAATGTCAAGTAAGSFTCTYAETSTPCGGTEVCANGACVAAGDKCEYTFDAKVSYVSHIALGNVTKDDDGNVTDGCCFDFNDDGKDDNKLGSVLGSLGQVVDVNGSIEENIASGDLVLLLETKGVEDVTADTDVDIAGFYGADADADLANNATGMSHFTVNPASFANGTASPLISFPNATIAASTLSAGPSLFNLSLSLAGATLNIAVSQTQLQGHVAVGANGSGLKIDGGESQALGAKLGGIIKMRDLFNALNTYVGSCECLTFADDMITIQENGKGKCNSPVTDTCGDADGACGQIPGYCSTLLLVLTPDIDLDGDECPKPPGQGTCATASVDDGISVGVWLKAESAVVDGVQECAE